jgi:mono/diheme cytochrome c family protein
MKTFLKWALLAVVVVAASGFLAFLYFIPPFFLTPPETFGKAMADAAPTVADIADPAERAIAERGRYIVMTTGCNGCHAIVGPRGPDLSKYLGGGRLENPDGARHIREPEPDAGQGNRACASHRR